MIAVVDYGVGNLFSLQHSLQAAGAEVVVTAQERDLEKAEKIVLPGVGAFGDAAEKLRSHGLDQAILRQVQKGKKLLGICLGMQLLFQRSYEFGCHEGLGLIPGEITAMEPVLPEGYKVPHIGWNSLHLTGDHPLFRTVKEGDYVYFVHSYYAAACGSSVLATTEYGIELTAAAGRDNVMGCQFHPEKSGAVGLSILRAFCTM